MSDNTFPLFDKPIHILDVDKKIKYQGVIIGKDDDTYLIQLYSFFDGGPTKIIAIQKHILFDPKKCTIYDNDEEWHKAYKMEQKLAEGRRTS